VKHYLSQGVDKIYLLDDASNEPFEEAIKRNPKVVIVPSREARERGEQMYDANRLYKELRSKVKWVLNVDVDEFVHSRRGRDWTLRRELETTFVGADCVFVPWIMFSFVGRKMEPKTNVVNELVYRWDHDKTHVHPKGDRKNRCRYYGIECKPVFKTESFRGMNDPHKPTEPVVDIRKRRLIYVDGAKNEQVKLEMITGNYHSIIREKDILKAHLICNHYRFTSLEKIKEKCRGDSLIKYKNMKNCVENCVLSDYPEIKDEYLKKLLK